MVCYQATISFTQTRFALPRQETKIVSWLDFVRRQQWQRNEFTKKSVELTQT